MCWFHPPRWSIPRRFPVRCFRGSALTSEVGQFSRGNVVSISHGAYSRRVVDPLAKELVDDLVAARPELASYPEVVWSWGRTEARCLLLSEWVSEHPIIDSKGRPSPVLRPLVQFERLAQDLRARLGLDPRSEAELVRSRADATKQSFDLEALKQRGREARGLNGSD